MPLIPRSLSIVVSVRKSEMKQTFDPLAFMTACYNFHLTILLRRPLDTYFIAVKAQGLV